MKPHLTPFSVLYSDNNSLTIQTPCCNFVVCYCSPDKSVEYVLNNIGNALEAVRTVSIPTIIAGDFNCRIDMHPMPQKTCGLIDFMSELGYRCCNTPDLKTYLCYNGIVPLSTCVLYLPV